MDLIPLILTFVGAYGVFLFLAYILAKVFFPSLEIEEENNRPKRTKDRHKRLASR